MLDAKQVDQPRIYSVLGLTLEIKAALATHFDQKSVWIRGEISGYRGRHQSGHMYFNLKDAEAVLKCVCFRQVNMRFTFDLQEGMEVILLGRLDVWPKGGNYQLIVEDIRSAGKGDLYAKFEALKAKLEKEGLFAAERKRKLPSYPRRIGVVTSPTGAVIRDIIHVTARRYPCVEIYLFPVTVQGEGAAQSISEALSACQEPTLGLDVLIVGRGGGSIEDLWAFNEERVARAIAASKVPIVSAVGHQTDVTIADFVADVRAATPSQAAELVTPDLFELNGRVDSVFQRMLRELLLRREHLKKQLARLMQAPVLKSPRALIDIRAQNLDYLSEKLEIVMRQRLQSAKERAQGRRVQMQERLIHFMAPRRLAFEKLESSLKMLNPLSILQRGYSVVKGQDGRVLVSSSAVNPHEQVEVQLYEGGLTCTVNTISKP